ncbi:hypothetical protein NC651_003535 [Populus alba x Populus x berolinensis]|nr:hypothetical protein NC651_003535 [Populus alba x Populus x berolinensis]
MPFHGRVMTFFPSITRQDGSVFLSMFSLILHGFFFIISFVIILVVLIRKTKVAIQLLKKSQQSNCFDCYI